MILLRVILEGQWRHIIFTALFYENIHGRYCACIQKRNNEHSHNFLIIVFKMKISSFSSVYNALGLNSLFFFFAMPQANKTKEIIGLRPMSFFKLVQCPRVWFFWGWYLKDSDVMHCSAPYSMKTFTLPAAYASKRLTMITAIIYSLSSSTRKVRHFLLSIINKDARAKMRVSWIRSTISLQQMSNSNILNSCHYSYSSLSTFWTSNLSLAMLIIGDC